MATYHIVGAGIIGLYTAYELLECGICGGEIAISASFLPGDESIHYTSPYAGGCFSCITGNDAETLSFDRYTYQNLDRLQKKLGHGCGLARTKSTEFWEHKPPQHKIASLTSYLEECVEVESLPAGCEYGLSFTAWNFNCPRFLVAFQEHLERAGVCFRRHTFSHIDQAFGTGTRAVFNCTGIGARTLGGVQDHSVFPTRGQVAVVKAPHVQENMFIWGRSFATYMIKRPDSRDQLVLGGFMQENDWQEATFREQTVDILQRATEMYPALLGKNPGGPGIADLEVLRAVAGLRPSRHGGVRIEQEYFGDNLVVHNYGASGYGYQAGLGMAKKAVDLALNSAKCERSKL